MHSVIAKLRGHAQDGIVNTQGEFGKLLSLSPLSVKLDEDPTPLEPYELSALRSAQLKPEDVGKKVALLRCNNEQFLLLGVVE
ncbi:hypothetical protein FB479_10853 [Brevibacillus sp. AG162]|uniref:hypothetical protein n=1 Tax=Brevibacillus sp. AG162 TaxID=2572910 RepID=UPI0011518E08|nr:hypothetical protein [Brevibacillus sp. AG162]TQK53840.1 hypothetical protein FB479_10853 [Brevibacillus sp. AG162]